VVLSWTAFGETQARRGPYRFVFPRGNVSSALTHSRSPRASQEGKPLPTELRKDRALLNQVELEDDNTGAERVMYDKKIWTVR